MLNNTSPKPVKKYVLDINENTIQDITKVSEKNRRGVEEIIALKKKRLEDPKTYYVNGIKVKEDEKKVQGLLKKLTEKNPDLAYEGKYNIFRLDQIKFIFILSIVLGIFYSFVLYAIYSVFMPAYRLISLPMIGNILIGIISGVASYEIILKKKEGELSNILLKGVVLDAEKEFFRQKIKFIFEITYFTPILNFALLILEYTLILAVF